jgi:hypothetical protein
MSVPDQDFFSTDEIATLGDSCSRLINRMFDAQRIRGFRDEKLERKVPRAEVIRFLQEANN